MSRSKIANETERIQVVLDKDQKEEFYYICKSNSHNPSELIRKWITEYLQNKKRG